MCIVRLGVKNASLAPRARYVQQLSFQTNKMFQKSI